MPTMIYESPLVLVVFCLLVTLIHSLIATFIWALASLGFKHTAWRWSVRAWGACYLGYALLALPEVLRHPVLWPYIWPGISPGLLILWRQKRKATTR